MTSRSITFERDINKSYMKVPAIEKENFDEKIIIRKQFEGILPMEKCFVNGQGQYWYLISGKQSLEDFWDIHEIDKSLYEKIMLRICNQLEVLEWNLVDTNCLVLSPQYIFLSSSGDEILFVLYPDNKDDIHGQLQNLLENIITKIDHSDTSLAKMAYDVYEMVLSESYSVADIKNKIIDREPTMQERSVQVEDDVSQEKFVIEEAVCEESKTLSFLANEKIINLFDNIKKLLQMEPKDLWIFKREDSEEVPEVVYPEEYIEIQETVNKHPTVCLSSINKVCEGVLIYEGREPGGNICLEESICIIGKNVGVNRQIEKETISNYHARISCRNSEYYIEDLNSTNGTFVNEEMLNYKEVRKLCIGDIVRFADMKYRFL